MANNTVKLSLASFDYYILKVNSSTTIAQVNSKLANLRKFDDSGRYISIEFTQNLSSIQQESIVAELVKLSNKYNFAAKFILANQFVATSSVAGLPVIDITANVKSKEIVSQSLLVEEPVRSGIKLEHEGDIIILNLVSSNAEIVAGGSIHVYGDGRGRLIAGNGGDKTARIYVQRFNAQLISIAGVYRALEEELPQNIYNQAVQVFLDEKQRLNIMPL